ncbi:hypothetical protein Rsub_09582 [Raphidocelis subcapitata]|uniref:Uncharacterized protein n=1 Tax=Raphidocelis subcapitata TaxID=307507 RepID=A0A2V0PC44_9CHLO|nr:hypothetical protein Rsub_09582 [Raphidocelis subcapitata]|eukprot:GBF97416.1 hypothetical protein Rsub_09582 [Raphidocelis subcapitata]
MRRSTLQRLQALCADRAAQVAALESANQSLRVRDATMRLAERVLAEVQRHHSAMSDDASELQLVRLQAILACPGRGSTGSTGGSTGSTGGSSTSTAWAPGLSASVGGLADGVGSSGSAADDAGSGDLLAAIPHLALGQALLRLEGVTREEVEAAKAMPLRELKARWTELVAEGRPFLDHEHTDPAAAAALSSVGAHMGRLLALACLWNLDAVFLKFMSTRTDGDEAALVDRASAVWVDRETAEDAGMDLWEGGVRAARLSREQGQITVAASDMFMSRLATLREERARLSKELALYTAEVAAAPHGSVEAHLSISALLEDIEASTRNESAAFMLVAQMMRVILTPRQYASLWCTVYPWPIHQMACVEITRRTLKSDPSLFAASVADP